jgi:hypothetical protein
VTRDYLRGEQWSEWNALASSLPDAIDTVITIPPSPGPGAFYRVVRQNQGARLLNLGPGRDGVGTESWGRLRVRALDIILDELFARMK